MSFLNQPIIIKLLSYDWSAVQHAYRSNTTTSDHAGEQSSLLLRPVDSRRNPRRAHGSSSLLSTAMRSTSSRHRRQNAGTLHRANSVASQSTWPHEAEATTQAARTPASVYGQLTMHQPQFSDSPAVSIEGNAEVSNPTSSFLHASPAGLNA